MGLKEKKLLQTNTDKNKKCDHAVSSFMQNYSKNKTLHSHAISHLTSISSVHSFLEFTNNPKPSRMHASPLFKFGIHSLQSFLITLFLREE